MGVLVFPILNVTFSHYKIMEGLFRKGWAANTVQTFMRLNVHGYRRGTVQAVRRKVLDVLKFESYYKTLPSTKLPSKHRIPELTWNRHDKYKIMYTFDVLDMDTGESFPQLGCHYDNNYLTAGAYAKLIVDELDSTKYIPNAVITNIQITQVTHRKDYPW